MWALREYIAQQKKEELKMEEAVADIEQGLPLSALKEELKKGRSLFHMTEPDQSIHVRDGDLYVYDPGKGSKRVYVETFRELLEAVPEDSRWTIDCVSDTRMTNMLKSTLLRLESKGIPQDVADYIREPYIETIIPEMQKNGHRKTNERYRQMTIDDTVEWLSQGTLAVLNEDKEFHPVGRISATYPHGAGPHVHEEHSCGGPDTLTILFSVEWMEPHWVGDPSIIPAEIAYRDPDPLKGGDDSLDISLELGMLVDATWHQVGRFRLGDTCTALDIDIEAQGYSRKYAQIEWESYLTEEEDDFDSLGDDIYVLFPKEFFGERDEKREKRSKMIGSIVSDAMFAELRAKLFDKEEDL